MRFFATPPIDGAFAELVVVHAAFAHPVPDSMSDDAAALLEPLSVGSLGLPQGAGHGAARGCWSPAPAPIGLVSVQTALAFGATSVAVSDVNPARLQLALELGATDVVDARDAERPGRSSAPPHGAARVLRHPARRSSRGSARSTAPAGRCSSAWAATSWRCRCRSCRSASSR